MPFRLSAGCGGRTNVEGRDGETARRPVRSTADDVGDVLRQGAGCRPREPHPRRPVGQRHRRPHRLRLVEDDDHGAQLSCGHHPIGSLRHVGAPVPGCASGGDGAAPRLWPGQPVLPTRPGAWCRLVRRRLSRRRRTAYTTVSGAGALPRRRGIRDRPGLARRRAHRPAHADDRRGADHVPDRGGRGRAVTPDRRPRTVG